ncbi:MAG: hypothetical protein ACHQJ6_05950 [Candidatus Berkiellales bacterium]
MTDYTEQEINKIISQLKDKDAQQLVQYIFKGVEQPELWKKLGNENAFRINQLLTEYLEKGTAGLKNPHFKYKNLNEDQKERFDLVREKLSDILEIAAKKQQPESPRDRLHTPGYQAKQRSQKALDRPSEFSSEEESEEYESAEEPLDPVKNLKSEVYNILKVNPHVMDLINTLALKTDEKIISLINDVNVAKKLKLMDKATAKNLIKEPHKILAYVEHLKEMVDKETRFKQKKK